MPEREQARPRQAGFGELLSHLLAELRSLFSDYAQLAVLDARRSALRLAWMLGCVVIASVLVASAWMGLVAALIVWLLGEGVSWVAVLAVAAMLNIAGAAGLLWWMRHLFAEMPFTALLRQLRGEPAPLEKPEGGHAH